MGPEGAPCLDRVCVWMFHHEGFANYLDAHTENWTCGTGHSELTHIGP